MKGNVQYRRNKSILGIGHCYIGMRSTFLFFGWMSTIQKRRLSLYPCIAGPGQCQHWEPHLQCRGWWACSSSWCSTSRRSCTLHSSCPSWGEESGSKERRIRGVWWWYGFWSFWLNSCNMFNKKLNFADSLDVSTNSIFCNALLAFTLCFSVTTWARVFLCHHHQVGNLIQTWH